MKEKIYKAKIENIKLNAIIYRQAFQIRKANGINGIMSQLKNIHQHSHHEVFVIMDGSLNVSNEQESVDYENCVLIIPPYYNHYTISSVKNGFCFYLSIRQSGKENAEYSFVEKALSKDVTAFDLNEDTSFYAKRLSEGIEKGISDENIVHLLSLLFTNLFQQLNSPAPISKRTNTQSKYRNYIHDIEQYLTLNIGRKFSLQDLADELYLCPKQVSRIIKKEYNCSFTELVNEKRLTFACMLLKETNLSIKQIAATVGYEYENYFFKVFKSVYGINPTQFRKDNSATKPVD